MPPRGSLAFTVTAPMRDLHSRMLAALLAGEGLQAVANLAAEEAGSPVAIVLPGRASVASDPATDLDALEALLDGAEQPAPDASPVAATAPIVAGEEAAGFAVALGATGDERNGTPDIDRAEVLRAAALAALTEVAVIDARDEVAGELRGSLIDELRAGASDPDDVVRRAGRLGCDLTAGAVALVAEVTTARPRHAAAVITGEHPGALAQVADAPSATGESIRVYGLLPALAGDESATRTLGSARRIVERLGSQGPAAFSSFHPGPAELRRAFVEAELMLDVIARDERMAERLGSGLGDGVYRLLFRALATDPEEVHRFFHETVEPLVAHDREYRTDLLGTLEAYLTNDCNMNATAREVYAHRHTVAHRVGRIRELTGLDPSLGEDRERLGLGIKAFRILEPTLPR